MKSITQTNKNDKDNFSSIVNFFKTYKISSILKMSNAYKNKRIPVIDLFMYIFALIYDNRSMYIFLCILNLSCIYVLKVSFFICPLLVLC